MKSKINKTHALDPYQYDKGYLSLNGKKKILLRLSEIRRVRMEKD